MKARDTSIDILRFIAVLLITNSHFDNLYIAPFQPLATGGSIGDALFFFCSGFTILNGQAVGFPNWYKHRIARIYPTVIATAIISAGFFGSTFTVIDVIIQGGGWFIPCIMIYYVLLYIISRNAPARLLLVFIGAALMLAIAYAALVLSGVPQASSQPHMWIVGSMYFKCCYFFLFMLLGSLLSKKGKCVGSFLFDGSMLLSCIMLWYGWLFLGKYSTIAVYFQVLALIPLVGAVYYLYKFVNCEVMKKAAQNKYIGSSMRIVGGLCLEIYLIQPYIITSSLNYLFPLNIAIVLAAIVVSAYLLRCLARAVAQTFREQNYEWRDIVKFT